MNNLNEEAYQRSLALLRRCLTPVGYVASPVQIDNYARIWARDGVITGLAALVSGEADLIDGLRRTLTTLGQYQGPHGEIPSNVALNGQQVSYGSLAGRVDSLLWYVIGVCAYVRYSEDVSQQVLHRPVVERALFLAGCWEYNNRGLLYTPMAGDWADEYIQEGYVLYDELLYMLALRGAGLLYASAAWQAKAANLGRLLAVNYWPALANQDNPLVYHPHAYRYQLAQGSARLEQAAIPAISTMNEARYWLPAFSPGGYATYFDGFAHALALLTDLGDDVQRQQAERYVQSLEQHTGSALLPAFWPVIHPGTVHWEQLRANHLYGELKNLPYAYHNGGLWPMITGFYAAALVRHGQHDRARHLLAAINSANAQGSDGTQWAFAEYHHGSTHQPMGTTQVAWSAAACILAHQALASVGTDLASPLAPLLPWPL